MRMNHVQCDSVARQRGDIVAFLAACALFAALIFSQPALALDVSHWQKKDETSSMAIDHTKWAEILDAYLEPNEDGVIRFDYGAVTDADRAKLKAYLADLQAVTVTSLNQDEQFAYWMNLYNALTIDVVLDHYPVRSIRNISLSGFFSIGPWKAPLVTVEGQDLSLDDIEHGILRALWKDPRIHYGVNCASIGCPNLQPQPFSADTVHEVLDQAARDYVNHPRGARVENGRLKVSSIYSWFKEDFGNNDAGVIAHLTQYANDDLKAKLADISRVNGYDYDWTLNDVE